MRGEAIADAYARYRAMAGDGDVRLELSGDSAAVERWGHWLLERLAADDRVYHHAGGEWRLRSGKLHEESERRLGELAGWSEKALAGQRELLAHVDDPGDSGTELEQSLSKLAAAGWSVDSKKDKGPPEVFFAAGDMPLATGDDWRAAGSLHPRFAAALALFVAAAPADRREEDPDGLGDEIARRLPALAIVDAGSATELLDLRTVAKLLRDAGALDLADGEPARPVLAHGSFKLRPVKRRDPAANGGGPQPAAAPDPNDPDALTEAYGADAVRFALLHAAAPAKRFSAPDDVVGYAATFLARLDAFGASHLDGTTARERIDGSDGLRRRLAGWCDTAIERTAENYQQLDMHRATRNVVALLERIEDFDARAGERGDADREGIAIALGIAAQLLAPLAPAAADELWRRGGRDGSSADVPWPSAQGEPTTA